MGGTAGDVRRDRAGPLLPRLAALAALLAVLAAAAVPARHGMAGDDAAAGRWGLLTSSIVAMGSAIGVLGWWVRARRRGRGIALWRAPFGLALLAWGVGQLLLFTEAARGRLSYPEVGDGVSALAAPLCVAGLLCVPRTSASSWPGLRLALDSLAVGFTSALAVRSVLLASPDGALVTEGLGTIVFLIADMSVLSLVVLAAIRDVRARMAAALCGVACHVVADVIALSAAADGVRDLPWLAPTLWCLGWPLVGLGIVLHRPRPPGVDDGAEHDRREAVAAQTATVMSAILVIATLLAERFVLLERWTAVLLGLAVAVLGLREFIGAALRVQLTAGLRVQAYRDPLTGLPNRRALTARIARIDDRRAWVVLTLDLDGFKQVNDLLGHHAGDDLLLAVAKAVRRTCPSEGLAARLGGDEFAVLSPGDLAEGARLGDRLRSAVGAALDRHAPGMGTSASVGVGRLVRTAGSEPVIDGVPRDDRLTALVESAAALRAAKAAGRDRVEVYANGVAAARERRIVLERRLRHAVATGAIRSYGQPVVDLADGALRGFESLARWTDEELGVVPPGEFIEVAEQTGLVVALGEQLVDSTLAQAHAAGAFDAGLSVAINASPIQLRVPGFVEVVRYHLERHDVPPHLVTIEVTEAILVADDDPALRTLEELAELGVDIAIDDFGTGYSALGYLRRLPVGVLKVDRSLTSSLAEPKTSAIVEGVVQMAHRLGIRVVMEGIENEPIAAACRRMGAEHGQGWLFGHAVPWDQAAELIARQHTTDAIPGPRRRS